MNQKPKFIFLFFKPLFILTVIVAFVSYILYFFIQNDYNKYVDTLFDKYILDIEDEFIFDIEDKLTTDIEDEFIDIYYTDVDNYENLRIDYLQKKICEIDNKNNVSKLFELSPVEIEIFDNDGDFICSNLQRNIEYLSRVQSSTKTEISNLTDVFVAEEIHFKITARYSFWYDCKHEIISVIAFLLVIDILFSFIISIVLYYKKRIEYENYQFRRNIMNSMAHDLKSPLMIISGYTQNLLEMPHQDIENHFLENILDTVTYMDRVIAKSLELYRLEDKRKESVKKEKLVLNELIYAVIERHQQEIDQNGLQLKVSGECTVEADYVLMEKIIENLITNIVLYAKKDSIVNVQMDDKRIVFTNEISGRLDIEAKDLFTPFVKGDKSRSGQSGTGLGLSIVKEMCALQEFNACIDIDGQEFNLIINFRK